MSAGAIVAIIVAVALVILVIGTITAMRRRQLRQRFGPEYDRVASEMRSQRKADAELAERERRVRSLDIHPLDETIRVRYAAEWAAIQERFVEQPEQAVTQARLLVTSVMKDRGYPTEDHDQILADLSVEHAGTLDHYRAAHQISMQAQEGTAVTENLRLAMLHYRALFSDLVGRPSEVPQSGPPPATEPSPGAGPAGAATDTRPPVTGPRSRPSG
jgi:Tfp pilus assembly protein PilX